MSQALKAGTIDPRLTLIQKALAAPTRGVVSGRSLDEIGRTLRRVSGQN